MTPKFPFLRGTFSLAGSSVPYFQLTLSAKDALSHLKVARELIFDPREIVLDELFQRDIDEVRVEKEIAPYLQRQGEIKFFSSLVVVLLPHENERLHRTYGETTSSNGKLAVGGIEVFEGNESTGQIAWDPRSVCPIVVDGQHRFSALRQIAKLNTPEVAADLENTSVPIVVLALHEQLGFYASSTDILSTVRKVFIDLNRQAKTVSETRNILLDDRDVIAVAVRSLLEKRVQPGKKALEERLTNGDLPLALVDWYSDRLKFDKSIHLTTILALYQIVSNFLRIPRLEPFDYDKAGTWLKRFSDLDPMLDFSSAVNESIEKKQPVFLGREQLEVFVDWFKTTWGPALAHVITELKPYARLLASLKERHFLDGELEPWAALDRAGKAVFAQSYGSQSAIARLADQAIESKGDDLAFQVVFQRGFIRAFFEMCTIHRATSGKGAPTLEQAPLIPYEFACQFVQLFNSRIGSLTANPDFWLGAAVRPDGAVIPSGSGEKCVAATVIYTLLAPFDDWRQLPEVEQRDNANDYAQTSYDLASRRQSEPWARLKAEYGKIWRASVRRYLQNIGRGLAGPAEIQGITAHIGRVVFASLKNSRGEAVDLSEQKPKTAETDLPEESFLADPDADIFD